METTEFTPVSQESPRQTQSRLCCPICCGPMIVLRSESRCCQCFFRMCESCDSAPEPDG